MGRMSAHKEDTVEVLHGRESIVRLLLEHGAAVDAQEQSMEMHCRQCHTPVTMALFGC